MIRTGPPKFHQPPYVTQNGVPCAAPASEAAGAVDSTILIFALAGDGRTHSIRMHYANVSRPSVSCQVAQRGPVGLATLQPALTGKLDAEIFRAIQFLHSTHDRTSCGDQSTEYALKKAGSHWEYHRSQSCGGRRPGFALPEKVRSPPAMELGEVETRRGGRARLLRLQGQGASVAGRAAPQVGPVFVSLWGCSNQTVVAGPRGIVILCCSRVPG